MKDKSFLDSNIILYSYSATEHNKNKIANELIFSIDTENIKNVILEIGSCIDIVNFSLITQIKAVEIKDKYKLQYYDSLIIATALENSCTILYTEDMQHNQIIENQLRIVNPFI